MLSASTISSGIGSAALHLQQRSRRLLWAWFAASVALHLAVLVVLPGFVEEHEPLAVRVLNVVLLHPDTPPAVTPESPPLPPPAPELRRPSRARERVPPTEKRSSPPTKSEEQDRPEAKAPPASPDPQPIAKPSPDTSSSAQSETRGAAEPGSEVPPPRDAREITAPTFKATYLRNPAPRYPLIARRNGEQGTVTLRVRVTREGLPASVSVEHTSGSGHLDSAALEAVRTWRFVPARQGSEPIEAWVLVPIVFRLEGTS